MNTKQNGRQSVHNDVKMNTKQSAGQSVHNDVTMNTKQNQRQYMTAGCMSIVCEQTVQRYLGTMNIGQN